MAPVTLAIYVLGAVLVLLVSFFVASPLFRPQEPGQAGGEAGARERWERQKRQALAAIKEIELDHEMGKVSHEDMATMRGRFEAQALEAMAALEREGSR